MSKMNSADKKNEQIAKDADGVEEAKAYDLTAGELRAKPGSALRVTSGITSGLASKLASAWTTGD
jgi:hypothetical protein